MKILKGRETQGSAPKRDESLSVTREKVRLRYVTSGGAQRLLAAAVDPTRFGDWEYCGRCTDF